MGQGLFKTSPYESKFKMSDILKFAVEPTSRLHLRDANDDLMYADSLDGLPDKTKPIAVNLYGPGSKANAKAQAGQYNRTVAKLQRKGKATEQTAEQLAAEKAQYLSDCTQSFENMELGALTGEALAIAVYSNVTIGFISDQVTKYLGDWSNFSKTSAPTLSSTSDIALG